MLTRNDADATSGKCCRTSAPSNAQRRQRIQLRRVQQRTALELISR
jgi:hypothetical protein